jgi:hypothetical protein
MKKGIVKCLRVQGASKRTFVANEIVSEDNFPVGVFDKLVSEGKVLETKVEKQTLKSGKKQQAETEEIK